ncbi:MAG: penicillin-binding protein activator [Rhodospirillales bacterium]|nr:penicillin-binding protein activator [Rhodospirillales bacterium]
MLAACTSQVKAPPPVVLAPAPRVAAAPPPSAVAVPRTKVALLLPMSGNDRALGNALLDAANLALFDVGDDRFEILPRDSGTTPDSARAAADSAIADGAQLILGPVFASSTPAVKASAARAGVQVISFSTDPSVAGGNGFVMGQLPAQQVRRVLGYAKSRGAARIALLLPDDAYGQAIAAASNDAAKQLGLTIGPVGKLGANQPAAIAAVKGTPTDAVLVGVGAQQARSIAPQLVTSEKKPQLLGTGLWDDSSAKDAALAGAWYAAPDPVTRGDFEHRFETTYGRKPPRLATLAYDAVAMAATLARSLPQGVPYDRSLLTQSQGFAGLDGPFRFGPDGRIERNLAVIELTGGEARVLDPAPPTFDRPGS